MHQAFSARNQARKIKRGLSASFSPHLLQPSSQPLELVLSCLWEPLTEAGKWLEMHSVSSSLIHLTKGFFCVFFDDCVADV